MNINNEPITNNIPIPIEFVERRIYLIRGQKVMLDRDLAELYQAKTIALRQQVKRNQNRFPLDFMFQLAFTESGLLVSQNVIPSLGSMGGHLPYVFTEHGVAMLSSVLRSERAVQMNILIIRAFVQMRKILSSEKDIADRFRKLEKLQKYQGLKIDTLFTIIQDLLQKPQPNKKPIGFRTK